MWRYAYMDVGGRALPGASAESTQSVCRERLLCKQGVGSSSLSAGTNSHFHCLVGIPIGISLCIRRHISISFADSRYAADRIPHLLKA